MCLWSSQGVAGCHGGWFKSVPDPKPCGLGGGSKSFRVLGAFLTSPFHAEQFVYSQVG